MKKILFVFLVSCCAVSCYTPRYVYSPPTQNIPNLDKKNDIELSAHYGTSLDLFHSKGNYNRGIDLHTAWAFSNHFAIMLNQNLRWEKNKTNDTYFRYDSSSLKYRRGFTEIGLGFFKFMRANKKTQFQVFTGAAFGSSKIFDDFFSNNILTKKYFQSRVTKLYAQPAFIFKAGPNFTAALSTRFTEILFSHVATNYNEEELNNYLLDGLASSPLFFWEPALTYTFGFKNFPFKFRVQSAITVLLNRRFVEHRSSNISFGMLTDFPQHKVKKKEASKN